MRITLGVGESKIVTVGGGRFYYENGAGLITVKTIGNDSAEFDLKPGMGFQNKVDQQNFFGVQIENKSGVQQDIDFIISYREVFDNRVIFGSALSVDIDRARRDMTLASLAFLKSGFMGGLSAVNACVGLRNPTGNNRRVWVKKIIASMSADARLFVYTAGNLAVVESNAAVSSLNQGGVSSAGQKMVRSPTSTASTSVIDTFSAAGVFVTGLVAMYNGYAKGNESTVIEFSEPVQLGAGNGLVLISGAVDTGLMANFEIVEEVI